MRKFLMLAAVVALVAAALAVPALAQHNDDDDFDFGDRFDNRAEFFDFLDDRFDFFNDDDGDGVDDDVEQQQPAVSQEIGQEAESGDVALSFDASSTGDFAQQCVAPLQFGNTGNLQNAQGFVQYSSTADDVEFEGSSFVFEPALGVQCDQAVQQSAAASSFGY